MHGNCFLSNRRASSVIILKAGRGASTNEGLNYLIYLTSAGCRLLLYLLVRSLEGAPVSVTPRLPLLLFFLYFFSSSLAHVAFVRALPSSTSICIKKSAL